MTKDKIAYIERLMKPMEENLMKKTYRNLPTNYSVCEHSDCLFAATCLHQIAYVRLIETEPVLHLINPLQCTRNSNCKYYRDNTHVKYARGFTGFQKKMFPGQYDKFMSRLISQFGRNPYFERRKGDYPLPPHEQEIVLQALREAGITEELKFDNYEQLIN